MYKEVLEVWDADPETSTSFINYGKQSYLCWIILDHSDTLTSFQTKNCISVYKLLSNFITGICLYSYRSLGFH